MHVSNLKRSLWSFNAFLLIGTVLNCGRSDVSEREIERLEIAGTDPNPLRRELAARQRVVFELINANDHTHLGQYFHPSLVWHEDPSRGPDRGFAPPTPIYLQFLTGSLPDRVRVIPWQYDVDLTSDSAAVVTAHSDGVSVLSNWRLNERGWQIYAMRAITTDRSNVGQASLLLDSSDARRGKRP